MPALPDIVIASDVATGVTAQSMLLVSFIVCAAPGLLPATTIVLPHSWNTGSRSATLAGFPDTITASVPASAPPTPPLIGSSMTVTSAAAHSVSTYGRTRPRGSTSNRTRTCCYTPAASLWRTRATAGGVRPMHQRAAVRQHPLPQTLQPSRACSSDIPCTALYNPCTAPVRRAGGRQRSQASVRSALPHWLPRSATGRHSPRGAVLRPGSGWCRQIDRQHQLARA
jgi:hypothetical protein